LATSGSTLEAAQMAAAPPTVAVAPAAADEVSVGIAQLFSEHAQDYQKLARQAAAFQEQFAQKLTASTASYASVEDVVASLLHETSVVVQGVVPGIVAVVNPFGYAALEQILAVVLPPVEQWVSSSPYGMLLANAVIIFLFLFGLALLSFLDALAAL
jgi:hypothetical protein